MMQHHALTLFLFLLVASTSAFTSSRQPWGTRRMERCMFSTDDNEPVTPLSPVAQPLSTMDAPLESSSSAPAQILTSTPVERPVMVARNMNTGEVKEVKWVDPAMMAHTNPFQMDW
jgi:hypothetical protein